MKMRIEQEGITESQLNGLEELLISASCKDLKWLDATLKNP
jgi:hypothetical protein